MKTKWMTTATTTLYLILFTILLINEINAKPTAAEAATLSTPEKINEDDNENVVESSDNNNNNNAVNEAENIIPDTDEDHEFRVQYSQRMLTYMNQSVSPCDDFYEYACGNWKNTIVERQSSQKRNNLLDLNYDLANMVEQLIFEPVESLKAQYASELEKAEILFQSCLNAQVYPLPKSQVYLDVIKSIGGFPAVDETWTPDDFSWFNMTAHLSNYGAVGFLNEDLVPQYPFPPFFRLPDIGFDLIVHSDNIASNTSRGYRLNEKRMHDYLKIYGVAEPKINKVIAAVFELWYAILAIADEINDDMDKCREIGEAADIDDWPEWNNYYEIAWNGEDFNQTSYDSPCPYFYAKLDEVCSERKEAVANYLAMKFLYRMDSLLEDEKFHKEYCSLEVKSSLRFLIDKLYLAKYLNMEIHTEVISILQEVRKTFRESLETLDWLDDETRKEALLKESTIVMRIGNYENKEMMERLIRAMEELTFEKSNFEKNNIKAMKFRQYMKRYNGFHAEELDEDAKPLQLLIGMQVNAFYYNVDNSINVMAGILHPPAYHKAWPYSLKFGTLGYLIGHELTHGFDTTGAYFDGKTDLNYWWSDKSGKVFEERADCYAKKFDGYVVPEIKRNINGNRTKDENIADNGGIRNALKAYHTFITKLSKERNLTVAALEKEERMPNLDLTPEQLFFLGFAQVWCAAYKEEHYWDELTNEHTMDKYRVLGAVSNVGEFAKVYNCPLGSNMNPTVDKCELW